MTENKQVYREKSLERISSPEQLNDYLKVTKPMVWVVLIAAVLLIVGFLIWEPLLISAVSQKERHR